MTFSHFLGKIKNGPFGQIWVIFLVSRRSRWRPKDSRPYVRACVRMSRCCSKTVHYFFSETLQLVRACKCEKNVPSAFLKKIPVLPILAKNFQNWPCWP